MKKILILGAGGFIGSHLTEALARENREFCAVDITKEKLSDLTQDFQYLNLDIRTDKDQLLELIQRHEIIVNLVAIANPSQYITDPLGTFELDFIENLWVVKKCVEYKKRLIQFSTSEVYGKSATLYDGKEHMFSEEETDLILGPINKHRWIYSSSKQLLERVIHAYGLKEDLEYSIIRPFNYIGPKIDFLPSEEEGMPRVFSLFMDALLYNKSMYLVNGGEQQRCYTDIRDATEAHKLILFSDDDKVSKQILNVGHRNNEISIKRLAEKMRNIWVDNYGDSLPKTLSISGEEFYGVGYEDSDRRIPDSTKIESLGWSPKYSIQDTLEYAMSYYVNRSDLIESFSTLYP